MLYIPSMGVQNLSTLEDKSSLSHNVGTQLPPSAT